MHQPTGTAITLSCPSQNNGNYVDATNFDYLSQDNEYLEGSHVASNALGAMVYNVTGNLQTPVVVPPWDNRNAAYNLCLQKLNEKVRGGLDLSVALAEAGTTTRMIKNVGKLLKHAVKLKPPGGYGSSRDVANGYLQYKYGWKPLMGDIFGAANESLRVVVNRLQRFSASARIPEEREDIVIYPHVDGVPDVPFTRKIRRGSFTACKIGLILEIPEESFQLNRWTSLNPVSVAYELIPYSFVVDWFVDIGSYLRDLETAVLYSTLFRSGYTSEIVRFDIRDECQNHSTPPVGGVSHRFEEVTGELIRTEFSRRRIATYPFPRRPTLNLDLSSGQLFSAAALLRQLLPAKGSRPPSPRGGGTVL